MRQTNSQKKMKKKSEKNLPTVEGHKNVTGMERGWEGRREWKQMERGWEEDDDKRGRRETTGKEGGR